MKGRFYRVVMIMMFVMRVSSRPLESNNVPPTFVPTNQGTTTQIMHSQVSRASDSVADSRFLTTDEVDRYGRGIGNRIGSRPPSCEHKCYGCNPCEATQVPTTTHVGIQYTNYEPEGWKCKCGPTFYSP